MLIIVAGLPGSGKSYFAEKLASMLGFTYINSDQLRQTMHVSGKYTPEDKLLVYNAMLREAAWKLEQKESVVVDATFYHHSMREMFVRLARAYNVPLHLIEIFADEIVIKERLKSPRKYSEADYSVYEKVRDDFEEITMPHLVLESADNNIDEMLTKARAYIAHERK
jgi:predicted kinase